jgi:innexin
MPFVRPFSMVAGFLDAIAKVRQFKFHNDDDVYDRLSRRFSVVLLMLFTVVVSTKQYVGDPIACFAPAQFTGKRLANEDIVCLPVTE